jgi:multisubunit Na+/H+ antiporter MnhG subunit
MARNKVDRDVPARFPSLFRNAKVAEKSDALRAWGIAIAPGLVACNAELFHCDVAIHLCVLLILLIASLAVPASPDPLQL